MKRNILMLLLLFAGYFSFAQSYQPAFDILYTNTEASFFDDPPNIRENSRIENISYRMSSYLVMYRATGDVKYLKELVKNIAFIISVRDDNMDPQIRDHADSLRASWSGDIKNLVMYNANYNGGINDYFSGLYSDGLLIYPMADFVHTVINNDELHEIISFENTFGYYSEMPFENIALSLINEINKTIDAHEIQWDESIGYYRQRDELIIRRYSRDNILPFNQQFPMTLAFIYMHEAYKTLKQSEPISYFSRANDLKSNFSNEIDDQGVWRYWPRASYTDYTYDYPPSDQIEDFSHGVIDICFATEFFNYYPDEDFELKLDKIANNIEDIIYRSRNDISYFVDGIGDGTSIKLGPYMPLVEFNEDNYHVILDIYLDNGVNHANKRIFPDANTRSGWGYDLKTVAYLEMYKNYLTPIGFNHQPGPNSEFAGITTGDFDGISGEEFVTVRNADGDFHMYKSANDPYENGNILAYTGFTSYGSNSDWSDVSAGDFDGDGIDEFVAARNGDGLISILEYDEYPIHVKNSAYPINNPNWRGIAGGNFDGGNEDEFVILNNNQTDNTKNGFYIYKYNPSLNRVKEIVRSVGWGTASDWTCATTGNFTGDEKDEFIVIRNGGSSKSELMLCRIANDNINISHIYKGSTNDNWVDVTAGNFDETYDEFVALNKKDGDLYFFMIRDGKIVLKGKEHFPEKHDIAAISAGNIDPSTPNDELVIVRNFDGDIFAYNVKTRKNAIIPKEKGMSGITNIEFEEKINNSDIEKETLIYPNPSNGSFTIQFNKFEKRNIQISDITGKIIFEINSDGMKSNINIPNIKGVYNVLIKDSNGRYSKKLIIK